MTDKKLKRSLSLAMITFFGLGNILGAGIYVLVGKVAGEAGYYAPLSFFIASVIAAFSACTYAEMSARYPVSAGEAIFVNEGLNLRWLTIAVGILITLAGVASTAVLAHGFAGYLSVFVDAPQWLMVILVIVSLGCLAIWGINESVLVASALTLLEILGLVVIMVTGTDFLTSENYSANIVNEPLGIIPWMGVFSGGFLAFYAYLGFEDMVNVAEEVKDPEKNMPRAIFTALIVSTVLYAGVSIVAIQVIAPDVLALSDAPLADVYTTATGRAPMLITFIGVFAVMNGALIQMIMASRLLYGMASRGWLPQRLAAIYPKTRTPVNSTIVVIVVILLFSLSLHLVALAKLTSYLVLMVFSLVNLSLVKIKLDKRQVAQGIRFSIFVPLLGFITSLALLLFEVISKL